MKSLKECWSRIKSYAEAAQQFRIISINLFLFGIGRSPEDGWNNLPQILNNNKKSRFPLEAGFFLAIQNLSDEEMYTIRKKAISFASK